MWLCAGAMQRRVYHTHSDRIATVQSSFWVKMYVLGLDAGYGVESGQAKTRGLVPHEPYGTCTHPFMYFYLYPVGPLGACTFQPLTPPPPNFAYRVLLLQVPGSHPARHP